MKRICSVFVLLICIIQIFVFITNNNIYAIDSIEDEPEFIPLSPEKIKIIYELVKNPRNTYLSKIYDYDNFMESYFDNLTINHGVNVIGSCGYVGIDMLLGYYDTYLNDSIIPEQYDKISEGTCNNMLCRRNSPGSIYDAPQNFIANYENKSIDEIIQINTEYYNYIDEKDDISLHAKLLTIGHSLGYYNYLSTAPAGASHYNVKQTIKKYMSDVLGFNYGDEYTICDIKSNLFYDSDDVRNFAIQKVCDGIPVLLSIEDEEGEGHWVVAYDYDEATDKIYCNFGWGGDTTHVTPENYKTEAYINAPELKPYLIYETALTIEFNISHAHSNNYAVTKIIDGNEVTNYYCYDSDEIELYSNPLQWYYNYGGKHYTVFDCGDTFEQDHFYYRENNVNGHLFVCRYCGYQNINAHTLIYDSFDDNQHHSYCSDNNCDIEFNNNHNLNLSSFDSISHCKNCLDCGYILIEYHSFQITTNENNHTKVCTDCGYFVMEEHRNWGYRIINNQRHEKYCLDCGYSAGTSLHVLKATDDDRYKRCTICGIWVDTGLNDIFPIQGLPPKDPEEETE